MDKRIQSFQEFWPYYLSQHSHPWTQRLHAVGLIVALVFSCYVVGQGKPLYLLGAPVIGYGFAWFSHFRIEKNRPATWQYPVWSFISEFRLCYRVLTGRVNYDPKHDRRI